MTKPHRLAVVLVALAASGVPAIAQDHQHRAGETTAEVPALTAMHEVIYPLWHEAWPNKDAAMMKELLPLVEQHAARVEHAELPGILRDKQAAWNEQVKALRATVTAYTQAAQADDTQALLDAVEALHSRFEKMVRLVRPVMKELDGYHQVLYRVYHKLMPEKKLDEMPAAAAELAAACGTLSAAAVPKRFAAKEAALKASFAELCAATEALRTVAGSGDAAAIGAAVEHVHTAYQKTEGLFG